jgi:O-antigen ligase
MLISEDKREKLFIILSTIFLLTFAWPIKISSWGMALFALIIPFASKPSEVLVRQNFCAISFFLFYLYITVPFLFLSEYVSNYNFVSTQIPFLALPVIFILFKKYINRNYLLIAYAVGVTVSLLFLLGYALYYFWDDFYLFKNGYEPVTSLIGMHSAYLSLYLSMGFLIILDLLIREYSSLGRGRLLIFIWVLFMGFGVLYIRSRMGIVSFLIVASIYLLLKLKGIYRWTSISIFISLIVLVYFIVSITEFHKGRFQLDQVKSSFEMKKIEWQSSLSIIKENPFFGVTEIKAQKMLDDEYRKVNFDLGASESYNSHNQFLTTLLQGGIIGFCLLFTPLFWLLWKGFSNNRILDFSVALLIILSLITESMLARHKGVIFFSFFILLFFNESKVLVKNNSLSEPDKNKE